MTSLRPSSWLCRECATVNLHRSAPFRDAPSAVSSNARHPLNAMFVVRATDTMVRLDVSSYAVSCMSSLMCMRLPARVLNGHARPSRCMLANRTGLLHLWYQYIVWRFSVYMQRVSLAMCLSAAHHRASPPCRSGANAPSRLAYAHTCSLRADIFFLDRLPLCLPHTPPPN
jgi:hypothetical protein